MAEEASRDDQDRSAPPGGGVPQILALLVLTGLLVWASGSWLDTEGTPATQTHTASVTPPAKPGPVSVHESMTTIRPDRQTPAGDSTATLMAARNEFESFQVAVEGGRGGRTDVRVALGGELAGPEGASIPPANVTVYREAAYHVEFPSDREGEAGDWYDALIPERDPYYRQDRTAFPYDIPPGGKMVAWVDVLVPSRAPAGLYEGELRVTQDDGAETVATVPVELRVLDWGMPSTSSLRSLYLSTPEYEPEMPCVAHDGAACDPDRGRGWLLHYLYSRAGLENRVTIANPSPVRTPDFADPAQRELFHRFVDPLLDGSPRPPAGEGLEDMRLRGAALETMWAGLGEDCFGACLDGWRRLLGPRLFAERFLYYLCDEPHDDVAEWGECAARATEVGTKVPLLVTAALADAIAAGGTSYLDVLVTNVTAASGADPDGAWLYTSCDSHGCGPETACAGQEDPTSDTDGWPGYVIDEPASQARAVGWMAYAHGAGGELYYSTTWSLDTAWTNQCFFGGNGDGTLFYPGRPDGFPGSTDSVIGGRSDIPIESIRLKRIRDGREDYEYLRATEARGGGPVANEAAAGLVGDGEELNGATFSQAELDQARCLLAGALDPSLGLCVIRAAP